MFNRSREEARARASMDTRQSQSYPNRPYPPQPEPSRITPWLIRLPLLGATAMMLLVFLAILGVSLHQLQYDGLIYPGVSSFGVKLAGLNKQQAIAALSSRYTYGQNAV